MTDLLGAMGRYMSGTEPDRICLALGPRIIRMIILIPN